MRQSSLLSTITLYCCCHFYCTLVAVFTASLLPFFMYPFLPISLYLSFPITPITVLSRSIKRNCAFSQVVTMVRLTLMYYIAFVAFMENPDKTWDDILVKEVQKAPPEPSLFD